MNFDYFYGEQSEQFTFYRTPKVFFTNDKFRGLSSDAKLLYGILLDRVSLSVRNNWYDEEGRVYIICTLKSIMDALGIADKTATKLFVELENIGLIERKKQGQGKPTIIYVKNFVGSYDVRFKTRNNYDSGLEDSTIQDSKILRPNNTDNNNTDFNYTYPFLSEDVDEDERRGYLDYFMEVLQIEWLKQQYPYQDSEIDEMLELILDVMCSKRKTIRIAGDDRSINVVKSRFMKLDSGHIQFVLDGLKDNTTRVRNIKQYILAALYNAPLTISNYYQSLVNHDMAQGKV
ncbi:DUF6017 domain-containing protein [[Clostridium] symbiosum]|uniref:DUF6017 domain-containing protein n=1 Tax=Clostridium symbiosum TaxID=1512 RepID=UPI001898DA7A|nr:DUF6017 domain-containing protein [[Clostridium] symbiosum]MBO1699753.1 replication initiator A domain-containing protein [[Clostridium] symbiosum]MDB1975900.1 DUF6017 domain-containing protein [[Clostridium] symbiosum]MDB2018318.1 DUF6017 domain-containing protein [[Clostridium] symbiosum]BDF25363.1 replication initiator A domain-containing protein [[Clostridium] symbiosum]BDF30268.1 replication initiator A domain-containing protein [[Clostridium] symbiosum]